METLKKYWYIAVALVLFLFMYMKKKPVTRRRRMRRTPMRSYTRMSYLRPMRKRTRR